METSTTAKASLRASMKALRSSMDPALRADASRRAVEWIRKTPLYCRAESCLAYLPFGSELDIGSLLDPAVDGKRVYVTRCTFATRTIEVCPYPCDLVPMRSGLFQPAPSVPALEDALIGTRVEVALVPGLAFSRTTRHRLGYGAGFYDLLLGRHSLPTIGVCFASQLVDDLPHNSHDVPVDLVATEEGVLGA